MKTILFFNFLFFVWSLLRVVGGDYSVLTILCGVANAIALVLNAERILK